MNTFVGALLEFQKLDSLYGIASAMANIALLYQLHGKNIEARAQYEQALSIFDDLENQAGITQTLTNLGLICQEEQEWEQAHDHFEQALAGYRELGDVHGEAIALVNLARLCALRGDAARAESFASDARALSEARGFDDQLARLEGFEAMVADRECAARRSDDEQ
ncbi:MAG: tetratricopeptide repeat protein [bacterium]|nr:tetratricopeptide repeat protein [bacterium]